MWAGAGSGTCSCFQRCFRPLSFVLVVHDAQFYRVEMRCIDWSFACRRRMCRFSFEFREVHRVVGCLFQVYFWMSFYGAGYDSARLFMFHADLFQLFAQLS